ncbi:MAG: serine/threonine-protein kinase [Sumerlaeia bacterium]
MTCEHCKTPFLLHRKDEILTANDSAMKLAQTFRPANYELLGVLGKGGMGIVYSAVRSFDGRVVAIKVLPPECAEHPELVERFDHEANLMASLSHPGIVPVLDRGRSGGLEYLVTEYIPGCTLKDRLSTARMVTLGEAAAVVRPVAEAVQTCHDIGLVHRDLKPANILLSPDGRVMVTDFGVANLVTQLGDMTDFGALIGTPDYVAPEQHRDGSCVTTAADQYSLGVIVYEMLTGSLPRGGSGLGGRMRHPGMTEDVQAILARALAWRPEDRYTSIRAFARALKREARKESVGITPEEIIRAASLSPAFLQPPKARSRESRETNATRPDTMAPLAPHPQATPTPVALGLGPGDGSDISYTPALIIAISAVMLLLLFAAFALVIL